MMKKLALSVCALLLSATVAIGASTVNPTQPAQNSDLVSSVVRNNFAAAYNDITKILGKYSGTTQPPAPVNLQDWVDTTTTPTYVFKIRNANTGAWVSWATLNINTGVFSVIPSAGGFAATAPLAVTFPAGVATYAINLNSNFAVSGSQLALASTPSARLIANCTGGSAEPVSCTWTSYADVAVGNTNGMIPYRTGGAWGTIQTGTSGAAIPRLDTANTWGAVQTFPSPSFTGTAAGASLTLSGNLTVTGSFTATGLVTNAALANPSTTVNGATCTLGSTCLITNITSNSPNALTVGANGATNPVLQVDSSAGSVVTGVAIVGGALGGGSIINSISSGTNEPLSINAKGNSTLHLNNFSSGAVSIAAGGGGVIVNSALRYGGITLSNAVTGTGNMVLSAAPTISGTATFSGVPVFSGLSAVACTAGLALDGSNNLVKVACPGGVGSIQVGTTGVTSGTTLNILYNNAGTLANGTIASFLTAGAAIAITGTTNATIDLTAARKTLPTIQSFTTGTNATYTTPANVLWIEVYLTGGGGGGGGGNNTTAGTAGGDTCWKTSGTACTSPDSKGGGGSGGAGANVANLPGAGGVNTGTCNFANDQGARGGPGQLPTATFHGVGGPGGGIGGGSSGYNVAGSAATGNSGGGGGGGAQGLSTINYSGFGGGSGGRCGFIINSPAGTYVYTVGTGNAGAAAGTNGFAGGAGAGGNIVVIEHYGT